MNTEPGVIHEHRPAVILEYLQVGLPKEANTSLGLGFAELRHWGFL